MPYLNQIVSLINQGLRSKTLTDKRFATGDYNGIAINIWRDKSGTAKEQLPCIYGPGNDDKYVGIDDKYPIIIYHKLLRNATQPAPASGQFGDGNKAIKALAILNMIVYADRGRIKLSHDDLEALVLAGMIDEVPKTEYPSAGFSSILVSHIETNFNALQVFNQEYQNVDFFLKPESILFQMTYKVESRYRKDCLATCGC